MPDVNVLDVLLHDEPIGTLTRVDGDRILFAFKDSYVADENRPVLGLGFKNQLGELITAFRPTRTRLMPFFSNLLPEGHMRTYLAERAGVKSCPGVFPALGTRHGPAGRNHDQTGRWRSVAA